MENVIKDLNESIEKHLPNQVGEVLRKRLEQADKDSQTVKDQAIKIDLYKIKEKELRNELDNHFKIDNKMSESKRLLKELEKKQRDQEIFELKTKLEAANSNTTAVTDLVGKLFRNTEYKNNSFKHATGFTQYDNNNMQHFVPDGGSSENTTSIAE